MYFSAHGSAVCLFYYKEDMQMIDYLEDLWYSRIHPDEFCNDDPDYFKKMALAADALANLRETFDENQRKLFREYEELNNSFLDYSDKAIFKHSYKLGANSILACLDSESKPILKHI